MRVSRIDQARGAGSLRLHAHWKRSGVRQQELAPLAASRERVEGSASSSTVGLRMAAWLIYAPQLGFALAETSHRAAKRQSPPTATRS